MPKYQKAPVTKLSDKFLGYCAVTPNRKFMRLFKRAGVKNMLISYHYIRKDPKLTRQILQDVRAEGGLFMTDSGAFSFLNDKNFDANTFDWLGYLEEYTNWLQANKEYIFSACNLDVDAYVGHETVKRWNDKYFKPLEKDINIIYVAHPNVLGKGELDCFKEYCNEYDYVAVNEYFSKHASSIYQTAKQTKTAIHGLAWTKPTILKDFPFFSVDSSSWVNYQKYGATPVWDGTNFTTYDKDHKDVRVTLKNQCEKYGVKTYEFIHEVDEGTDKHNDDEGLTYSLRTWMDVFQDLKRYARTKLIHDLKRMLDGKITVFMEDKSGTPKKRDLLGGMLDGALGDDVTIEEAKTTKYEVQEDGTEIAIYDKREKTESITEYKERAGDVMVCNYCHLADKCPKFKQDSTCGFNFATEEMVQDPLAVIDGLIKLQMERVHRAMFFEKMEGGMPNKMFAMEVKLLNDLNNTKTNMLMMMQAKGLRITEKTVEFQGLPDGTPPPKKEGFAELLKNMMGNE